MGDRLLMRKISKNPDAPEQLDENKQPLTAGLAGQIARRNLKGPVIQPWVEYIEAAIRSHARDGKFELNNPWADRRSDIGRSCPEYPTTVMQKAIKEHFQSNGFVWKSHPDPDPGHPGSGPYDSIHWD